VYQRAKKKLTKSGHEVIIRQIMGSYFGASRRTMDNI